VSVAQLAAVLGLMPGEWSAIGQMLVAVSLLIGGLLALHEYRRTRRQEAVRWLHEAFKDFYLGARFDDVRHVLEYDHPHPVGPLLERRIEDPTGSLTREEMQLLQDLDTLITYLEHVLYLEEEDQISSDDHETVFHYWFHVMSRPDRPDLLRYVRHFRWRLVTRELELARARHDEDAP
jgi:hypothetical protein